MELGGRFVQLRLERPLVPSAGDRIVIRSLAPPDTLGGGVVLDPAPRRHGPSRDLLATARRGASVASPSRRPAQARPRSPSPEPQAAGDPPTAACRRAPAPARSTAALALEARLREAGHRLAPDSELDPGDLAALREAGRVVRLGQGLHAHPDARAEVERASSAWSARQITLAELRDALGTSRRYAQAWLEHLDAARVTLRVGDAHVVRRSRQS